MRAKGKKEHHLVMTCYKPPIFSNNGTIRDDYLKYKIRGKGQGTIWLVVVVGDKRLFQLRSVAPFQFRLGMIDSH